MEYPTITERKMSQQQLDVTETQQASYEFKFTLHTHQDQVVEISGRLNENSKNELIKLILETKSV
jgi:hypothetical protein